MINVLSADEQAETINYAMKFEEFGYNDERFENFMWHLKKHPNFRPKLMKFCRETCDLTRKLYFAILFTDEIDNMTFHYVNKKENPIVEFFQWVAALTVVFGGGASCVLAFNFLCIALSV